MPKQNRFRRVGTVQYTPNGVEPLELPRAILYHNLMLRLSGLVDIVTAAGLPFVDSAPFSLIRRLEIIADGKDTLKSIEGEALKEFGNAFYGSFFEFNQMPTALGPDQAFNAYLILPFEMPRSRRPIDTLLDSAGLSTLELRVTWGAEANVYETNVANHTIHTTKLEVSAFQAFGIKSNFSVFKQLTISKEVNAVTPDMQILMPVGNLYRGLMIRAVNYDVGMPDPGFPSNAIINNIKVQSGTEVFVNQNADELQDDNKRHFGFEGTWPLGLYIVDFTPDGLLSESLDARPLSSLEVILDVNNPATTNRIKISPLEVIQPRAPIRNGNGNG